MCKELVLLRDVINIHHPEFKNNKRLQQYALEKPNAFNVEFLIEESLAAVGGYNFVDEAGRDFDDPVDSDSKTVSLNVITRKCEITGVENKIGALRITIYNPLKDAVDFLYMTHKELLNYKLPCYGKNSFKERLCFNWNKRGDHYNSYEQFRVLDFEHLATIQQ